MLYDVTYIGPNGSCGVHYAVIADSEEHAAKLSPLMLTYSSAFSPTDYVVINVIPSIYIGDINYD